MSDNNANNQGASATGDLSPAQSENLDSTARFDRDELVRGWRAYEVAAPRTVSLLKFAAKTDMGQVRENNEDKFDFYEPEDPAILAARGCLYAVADGMGGALAGQIASEMMLKQVIAGYYDHPSPDPIIAMRDAICNANDRIYTLAQMIPERNGMGTTLVAILFIEDRTIIAQVGDSRVYRVREGEIEQVTCDHSWVEEQVRAGVLTRSEAEMSPFRNVITRSIGATPAVQPDFYQEQAHIGDTWLLCSDGLTGHVEDGEIARIVGANPPSEAARQLIELANARGGRDNITVFILSVRDLIPFSELTAGQSDLSAQPVSAVNAQQSLSSPEQTPTPPNGAQDTGERKRSGWRRLFGL